MDRCEALAERFFNIIEEGGEYVELFLIRDLMMNEYIEGRCSQIEIVQIDDIIEESLECYFEDNEIVLDYEVETLEKEIFGALYNRDGANVMSVDRIIELMNNYGECANAHPYMYYTFVRELERITGETLIELCL